MGSKQYIEYIEEGLGNWSKKQFRKIAFGPVLLVLLCGGGCIILGGGWLILFSIMVVSSIVMTLGVFITLFKPLTLRNQLVMRALIYSNYVLQFLLLQTMCYIMAHGFDCILILTYIPALLTPVVLGLHKAKYLRLNCSPQKKISPVFFFFGCTGIIGVWLAKPLFQQLTNLMALTILILCLMVLSCVFSIGLLSYQKLYYLKKYANL